MFPLTLVDSIAFQSPRAITVRAAITAIENRLASLKPTNVQVDESSVAFSGGFFRLVSRSNLLGPISRGYISIESQQNILIVNYRLTFTQLFVSVTLGVFGFLGPFLWGATNLNPVKIGILFIAWNILFGANYMKAREEFPAFIRDTLSHSVVVQS